MKITMRVSKPTDENLRFAKQLGVNHIIAYVDDATSTSWEFLELLRLKRHVERYGLEVVAIGSPPARSMQQVLLASPERNRAIGDICTCIQNMGRVGIPILGYNFSYTGTWGRWREGLSGGGRGDAGLMSFDYDLVKDAPLTEAGLISAEEMRERLTYFLERVLPVAEEAAVKLACHPDDPPAPVLRGIARIHSSVSGLKRLIETVPSPSNGILFCLGTVAEMGEDVYDAIRYFCERDKVFVVHFRNIRRYPGPSLRFDEVFIDEGDVDMLRALRTFREAGYAGPIDPDHAPVMVGDSQWGRERGRAFAIGYMRAMMQVLESLA